MGKLIITLVIITCIETCEKELFLHGDGKGFAWGYQKSIFKVVLGARLLEFGIYIIVLKIEI